MQTAVKGALLQLFQSETNKAVRRKVNDCIGMLAAKIAAKGEWQELLPLVLKGWGSDHSMHKESVLEVLNR
jgi:hypothetical protein